MTRDQHLELQAASPMEGLGIMACASPARTAYDRDIAPARKRLTHVPKNIVLILRCDPLKGVEAVKRIMRCRQPLSTDIMCLDFDR